MELNRDDWKSIGELSCLGNQTIRWVNLPIGEKVSLELLEFKMCEPVPYLSSAYYDFGAIVKAEVKDLSLQVDDVVKISFPARIFIRALAELPLFMKKWVQSPDMDNDNAYIEFTKNTPLSIKITKLERRTATPDAKRIYLTSHYSKDYPTARHFYKKRFEDKK